MRRPAQYPISAAATMTTVKVMTMTRASAPLGPALSAVHPFGRALCTAVGHRYVDNGPALREFVAGVGATRAWCKRCRVYLPVEPEAPARALRWSTGWEGR